MISRTATSKCRICRAVGILPIFLLGCVIAWLAAGATGWISAILAFVFTIFCGALALRAGCQIAFPDLPSTESPQYADPELFAPLPRELPVEELSPGLLEDDLEDIQNLLTEDSGQDAGESISESQNMFDDQDLNAMERDADLFHDELLSLDDGDDAPNDEADATTQAEEISREVERLMQESDQSSPQAIENKGYVTETNDALPDAQAAFDPPQPSGRPSLMSDDPGRRLAQNLVMVGASPSHGGASTSSQSVSLRPATLNTARSTGPDDLKLIRGVGDALEGLLHKLGYFHFDQIAAWTPEEVRWVDENLDGFKGRVSRDHWVSQAIVLAQFHRKSEGIAAMIPNLRPDGTPDSNTQ